MKFNQLTALVLDADSSAGLETLQSLGRNGVATHVAAFEDCPAFHSRRALARWKQPSTDEPTAFVRWLRELDDRCGYSLIVPSTEWSLRMLLSLDEDDPLVRKAVIAPRASLEVALDKWATWALALRCGVPTPPTRLIAMPSDIAGTESFPVVLKALHSIVEIDGHLTHVPARLVRNGRERDRHCQYLIAHTHVIEQSYMVGHGVGIELLYSGGRRIWHFCHVRLHEGNNPDGLGGGSSYRRSSSAPPELLKYATDMLDRLSWHGVAMVEFLVSSTGESWLMEINPRLWGSLALAIDAGVDFPMGLLHVATGQLLPPQPRYRVPCYTRRMPADILWLLRKMRTRTNWVMKELLLLLRALTGNESWDHFDWGDLRVTVAAWSNFPGTLASIAGRRLRARLVWSQARRLHRNNLRTIMARNAPVRTVLFLCHGNICRSPVAGAMARSRLPGCEISSAGFIGEQGRPSPSNVLEVARTLGFDMSGWRSLRVSRQMVESADAVFIMDMRNLQAYREEFGSELGKLLFLGMLLPSPAEIADPYEQDMETTREILQQIQDACERAAKLLSNRPG